jgi:hypothetical protein
MKKPVLLLPAAAAILVLAIQSDGQISRPKRSVQGAQAQTQPQAGAPIQKIGTVTRNQLLQKVNQIIKIDGFFYNGSIPMVIDNIQRVYVDMALPVDSYVPIVGPVPGTLRSGDRITVEGTILRPTAHDPLSVRHESVIIKFNAAQSVSRLTASAVRIAERPMAVGRITIPGRIVVSPHQVKYAVLIVGGIDPANNHVRYWNDLTTMYAILRASGYSASNIYVLYADGTGRDASVPVNYSATKANISTVFDLLASKISSIDKLYIMLNDHGSGLQENPPGIWGGVNDVNGDETFDGYSESTYHRDMTGDGDMNDSFKVDEALNLWFDTRITDDEFATEVNKINSGAPIIIQMKQCFCGGFTADLTRPNRIIMASCTQTQPSWSNRSATYGEFTFWYFAALTGSKPDGSGAVNADANGDGKISILEAYNFARANDSQQEMPNYEDDGVIPCHSGAMPWAGEGLIGAAWFL